MIYQFDNPLISSHKLIHFLKLHHNCDDKILITLGPDVVRLDCMDGTASASIELKYITIPSVGLYL